MTFLRQLLKVEVVGLASLSGAAAILAALAALQAWLLPSPFFTISDAVTAVFGYALLIGAAPVIVFAAPLYAWLGHKRRASVLAALAIGAIPGVALFFVATPLGVWGLVCGVVVALVTHRVCASGSNNSSKRTRVPRAA